MHVYVPCAGSAALATILSGSGIVSDGERDPSGRLVIDFEGNRYGSTSMTTYADRVDHAAGRHLVRYPTVARLAVLPANVIEVANYDTETGVVTVHGPEEAVLLAEWCRVDEASDAGLVTEANGRHNRERDWRAHLHSPDPGVRRMAERQLSRDSYVPAAPER